MVQHAFDTPNALLEITHNKLSGPAGYSDVAQEGDCTAISAGDDRITASDALAVAAGLAMDELA